MKPWTRIESYRTSYITSRTFRVKIVKILIIGRCRSDPFYRRRICQKTTFFTWISNFCDFFPFPVAILFLMFWTKKNHVRSLTHSLEGARRKVQSLPKALKRYSAGWRRGRPMFSILTRKKYLIFMLDVFRVYIVIRLVEFIFSHKKKMYGAKTWKQCCQSLLRISPRHIQIPVDLTENLQNKYRHLCWWYNTESAVVAYSK